MMYWYGDDMGWWGYAGMALVMAAVWVLVIGCLVALVKYLIRDRPPRLDLPSGPASPAGVLAARFARGEIDEAQYRDCVAVLRETQLASGSRG